MHGLDAKVLQDLIEKIAMIPELMGEERGEDSEKPHSLMDGAKEEMAEDKEEALEGEKPEHKGGMAVDIVIAADKKKKPHMGMGY